jgi:hypothetical protein
MRAAYVSIILNNLYGPFGRKRWTDRNGRDESPLPSVVDSLIEFRIVQAQSVMAGLKQIVRSAEARKSDHEQY